MTNVVEDIESRKKKKKQDVEEVEVEEEGRLEQPLLEWRLREGCETTRDTLIQRAIAQTFKSTAHLANLLPTGTVLAFQFLVPIFTNQGSCDATTRTLTTSLIVLCGISCFVLSFSDSFKDDHGAVRYGMATFRGLWVIDGSLRLPPEKAAPYRIKLVDFMHAFVSVLVFAAVALFNQSVVSCFYPTPSKQAQELLTSLPVGIGVICSMLFVAFPSTRHGIGFPVAPRDWRTSIYPRLKETED